MKLKNALDEKNFDVRLRDRQVAQGKLTKEQVDQYLKQLPEEKSFSQLGEKEEKKVN